MARRPMRIFGIMAITGLMLSAGPETPRARTFRVGGSSTLAPLIQEAVRHLRRRQPEVVVEVEASTSQRGLDELAEGGVDAALSGLPPSPALLRRGVRAWPLALQAFVIVVNPDVPEQALRDPDWAGLFAIPGVRWPGTTLPAIPILRPRGTATQQVLEAHVTRGVALPAQVRTAARTADLLDQVARTPGALGLAEYGQARAWEGRVRILPWRGVPCGPRQVKAGRYPLVERGSLYSLPGALSPEKQKVLEALLGVLRDPEFQAAVLDGQLGQFPLGWSEASQP